MRAKIHNFCMVRGDTVRLGLSLKNTEAVPDEVHMTCRRLRNDTGVVFHKDLADGIQRDEDVTDWIQYVIRIAPEDTQALDPGSYAYDIELLYGEDTYTPVLGQIELVRDETRRPLGGGG